MSPKQQAESEKVIQQVLETFRKYMPWSVSFFGNERLLPLVDYMTSLMKEQGQQVYITYPVTLQLVQQAETLTQQIRDGNMQSITAAFETLIQIVDLGVTSLVREPKKRFPMLEVRHPRHAPTGRRLNRQCGLDIWICEQSKVHGLCGCQGRCGLTYAKHEP